MNSYCNKWPRKASEGPRLVLSRTFVFFVEKDQGVYSKVCMYIYTYMYTHTQYIFTHINILIYIVFIFREPRAVDSYNENQTF